MYFTGRTKGFWGQGVQKVFMKSSVRVHDCKIIKVHGKGGGCRGDGLGACGMGFRVRV